MKFKFLNGYLAIHLLLGFNLVIADDTGLSGAITNVATNEDQNSGSTLFSSVGSVVDGAHDSVNTRFKSFVIQVDDFIGSAQSDGSINKSWARVRVDTIKTAIGETEFKAKVKLRLVLPQSEKRFRLLLSSGDDDQSVAGTDTVQRQQLEKDDEEVALALRFLRKVRERSSVKFDVGIRSRDSKVQLFGRIGAVAEKPLNDIWTLTTSNDLYHYRSSGYENRLKLAFQRLFYKSDRLYFRNSTEIRWLNGDKGASIGGIAGIYADRGPKSAYAFEVLGSAITSKNDGAKNYYQGTEIRVRIRRNAFRPWLYFEVWPNISWSESNNYKRAYGGRIRVEMNFGR
ncbi:MAG: hypothetical protein V3U65_10630 [Granulosicoccaceae bacterium]